MVVPFFVSHNDGKLLLPIACGGMIQVCLRPTKVTQQRRQTEAASHTPIFNGSKYINLANVNLAGTSLTNVKLGAIGEN